MNEKVAFLFPGQGSQYIGMGAIITSDHHDLVALAERKSGLPLQRLMQEGPLKQLSATEIAQPAILLASLLCNEVLFDQGLVPAVVAGHSLGEYTALVCSGVLAMEDAFSIVTQRGRLMAQVREGGMSAILKLPLAEVEAICKAVEGEVSVANYNGRAQIVISGDEEGLTQAGELAKRRGGRVVALPVSGPFHSSFMARAEQQLSQLIESIEFSAPCIPLVSSINGETLSNPCRIKTLILTQITAQVNWVQVIDRIEEMGIKIAIEVGPGEVLTRLGRNITSAIEFLPFVDYDKIL
ncbi:ACP S-malonyltransferase [Candidatus Acetothermia bacterium]|nr:ACP S-malonyltransferase [Candidatus Acetothermia bacterium]